MNVSRLLSKQLDLCHLLSSHYVLKECCVRYNRTNSSVFENHFSQRCGEIVSKITIDRFQIKVSLLFLNPLKPALDTQMLCLKDEVYGFHVVGLILILTFLKYSTV